MIDEIKNKSLTSKWDDLVIAVNEVHHDFIDKSYHVQNKMMFEFEKNNWKEVFKMFNFKNKKILEIGTGTGFLPMIFIECNIPFEKYTCTDISQNILNQAKNNITSKNPKVIKKFEFIKLNSQKLPFQDESYDYIVLNSVLHHLPNIDKFYEECSRVLRKGGFLIIGHEPNKYFFESIYSLPYKILFKLFQKIGNFKSKLLKRKTFNDEMADYVNKILFSKNLVKIPLTPKEISYLVDFHASKGIDFKKFPNDKFELYYIKTYAYLGTLNYAYDNIIYNTFVNILDAFIKKFDMKKQHGGNYFTVYEKL